MAYLADLCEGMHLRALVRGIDPLNKLHKEAIRAFANLFDEVAERCTGTFGSAPITAGGVDLDAVGLKRSTATWTYLVHDSPFGSDIGRALRSVGRFIRKVRTGVH